MELDKHTRKKIIGYIEKDNFQKLKKYIKNKSIDLNELITSKGDKMLHLCCKEGSVDSLAFLLKLGANPHLVNNKGDLPIHLAAKYCIKHYTKSIETDLVSALLTYCSGSVKQKNFSGVSVNDLLDDLEKVKRRDMFYKTEKRKEGRKVGAEESEDEEWRNKLLDESELEFEDNMGKYEYDESYVGVSYESFDEWADRIYKSFSSRRKRMYDAPSKREPLNEERPSTSKKPKLSLEASNAAYMQLKERQEKKKYETMFFKLFSSDSMIRTSDIPLDGLDEVKIVEILLDSVKELSKDEVKSRIREEIRRWHPDKFMQKLGARILDEEKIGVMEKVKMVSQALNAYGK